MIKVNIVIDLRGKLEESTYIRLEKRRRKEEEEEKRAQCKQSST